MFKIITIRQVLIHGLLLALIVSTGFFYYLPLNSCVVFSDYVPYSGGNGQDQGMRDAINWPEIRNTPHQGSKPRGYKTAIIDTGLDPDVYNYVKNNWGLSSLTIKYIEIQVEWYWWPGPWPPAGWYYRYIAVDITSQQSNWADEDGHGTYMFSTAVQVAQGGEYIILDIGRGYNYPEPHQTMRTETALKYLVDHVSTGLVVSMSWGYTSLAYSQYLYDEIQYLYNHNAILFAARGNDDNQVTVYPAAWSEVIAVGAVFDTRALVDGRQLPSNYPGQRVSKTSDTNNYKSTAPFRAYPWGSSYGSDLFVVAPGFDIEALHFTSVGLQGSSDVVYMVWEGTSFSTPVVAASASVLIWCNYVEHGSYFLQWGSGKNAERMKYVLKQSSEMTTPGNLPTPNYNDSVSFNVHRGWGILDLYDAYQIVIQPS